MSNFFQELERRNVFKSAIAYLVVSWIIIQVAQSVLPTFGASEGIIRTLIILLAIGLPIWLIVSWVYDITPEGLTKTPKEPKDQIYKELINKRTNAFIIVSLSIAVIVMGLKLSNVFSSDSNDHYAIAVLPFVNMSDDIEQEYFSDGISEEIINMLSQVPGLKVMARTSSFSFKGKNQNVKEIGEQLKVTHILEGSVRKSGNMLRITAQLVNTSDGSQIFSEQFDRELKDVFDIQDEISQEILEAIKIRLIRKKKDAVFKKYTDNIEAYQFYLKGKFYYNQYTKEDFLIAIEYFKKAIAIDPDYAIAYAAIAYSYQTLGYWIWLPTNEAMPLALEAANKAIELDDKSAECLIAKGRILSHYYWNLKDADVEFEKAQKLNPNNPEVYIQLMQTATLRGDFEKAYEYSEKALKLDPFSKMNLWMATVPVIMKKDFEKGKVLGNQIIELDPDFWGGHSWLGFAYLQEQRFEEGFAELLLAKNLEKGPFSLSIVGRVYAKMGDTINANKVIKELKEIPNIEDSGNNYLGRVYVDLGDFETAFKYYNKAIENRESHVIWQNLQIPPEMKEDPKYAKMVDKMDIKY